MTSFILKLIAMLTMTIDHAGAMIGAMGFTTVCSISTPFGAFVVDVEMMRAIGRIAFPIYAFLVAEGCKKTRNPMRYVARLFVFALISELPFNLLVSPGSGADAAQFSLFFLGAQNVFFTLGAGALVCVLYERMKETSKYMGMAIALVVALAAEFLHTDYSFYGVTAIFAAYLCRNTKESAIAVTAIIGGILYYAQYAAYYPVYAITYLLAVVVAGLLMFVYNGKPGPRAAWMKWGFYVYYPLHILVIAVCGMMYLSSVGKPIFAGFLQNWF